MQTTDSGLLPLIIRKLQLVCKGAPLAYGQIGTEPDKNLEIYPGKHFWYVCSRLFLLHRRNRRSAAKNENLLYSKFLVVIQCL